MDSLPLQKLFYQHYSEACSPTHLEQVVDAYLKKDPLLDSLLDTALACETTKTYNTPWEFVDAWRQLLVLLILIQEMQLFETKKAFLVEQFYRIDSGQLCPDFQLLLAYRQLIAALLDLTIEQEVFVQLPSGACPLEGKGMWSWGEVPHPAFHAELGLIWCLHAALLKDDKHLQAVENLANWQLNTLAHDCSLFAGLFAYEGDISPNSLAINNYLFFNAISKVLKRSNFAFFADKMENLLIQKAAIAHIAIPPFAVVVEQFLNRFNTSSPFLDCTLNSVFSDKHLAMVGSRSNDCSAVATLYGSGSGMGCYHHKDIHIVSFGPQHYPLGDCRGFGIEGGNVLLNDHVKSLGVSEGYFKIEGLTRMSGLPTSSNSVAEFRHGNPSGVWVDAKLVFEQKSLSIETVMQNLFDYPLAFVFFIKASGCVIDGGHTVKPRSFQQYAGEIGIVEVKGRDGCVSIESGLKQGEMHVIPLGGGENFWGADFLIAYPCPAESQLRWKISPL